MDATKKVQIIARPPTEEIVKQDELKTLFETNSNPRHYIGLEVSGFLHLGSLISTGFKINDFIKAGVNCTVFLADWHTIINDKLGGDPDIISKVSQYYTEAFKLVCPSVNVKLGSELYDSKKEYWSQVVRFAKHMSLARTMRTLTIMGRSENEEKIDLAKLWYPPMQAVDMHFLDVDIAHSGMDQRKIHMLAREIFPKMGWKAPVSIHQSLLPGLTKPISDQQNAALGKMSKSEPDSGIFIHDTNEQITRKIKKSWCQEADVVNNPLLEIAKQVIFHEYNEFAIERPQKFGGNTSYADYKQLESSFKNKELHPTDLKQSVSRYLIKIISPIRDKLNISKELQNAVKNK